MIYSRAVSVTSMIRSSATTCYNVFDGYHNHTERMKPFPDSGGFHNRCHGLCRSYYLFSRHVIVIPFQLVLCQVWRVWYSSWAEIVCIAAHFMLMLNLTAYCDSANSRDACLILISSFGGQVHQSALESWWFSVIFCIPWEGRLVFEDLVAQCDLEVITNEQE